MNQSEKTQIGKVYQNDGEYGPWINFYTMENMYKDAETFAATTASMDAILAASPYGQIPNQAGDDGIIRFAQGEY